MAARLTDYDRMFPLGDPPNYEPAQDSSFGAQARRENRDPREVVYDYLIEGEGKNFIFAPFANFAAYNLDCCSEMMQSPHTLIGLGDGGAHVGLISDGSFPTSLLPHWGRDRKQGRLDVSWLVKRHTLDNARRRRAERSRHGRGRLQGRSQRDRLRQARVEAPVMKWDPGRRQAPAAEGNGLPGRTVVTGVPSTYRDGEATGALPGRLVRKARGRPVADRPTRTSTSEGDQSPLMSLSLMTLEPALLLALLVGGELSRARSVRISMLNWVDELLRVDVEAPGTAFLISACIRSTIGRGVPVGA